MTTIITNGRTFLFVPVPDDGYMFSVDGVMFYCRHQDEIDEQVTLPIGKYTIHSDTANMTEEQASDLAEAVMIDKIGQRVYVDYSVKYDWFGVVGSLASFESLLLSRGLSGRLIVLEKL